MSVQLSKVTVNVQANTPDEVNASPRIFLFVMFSFYRVAAGSKIIWDSQKSLKSEGGLTQVYNKSEIWWFDHLVFNWSQILGLPSRVTIKRQLSTSTICHTSRWQSHRELSKSWCKIGLPVGSGDFPVLHDQGFPLVTQKKLTSYQDKK